MYEVRCTYAMIPQYNAPSMISLRLCYQSGTKKNYDGQTNNNEDPNGPHETAVLWRKNGPFICGSYRRSHPEIDQIVGISTDSLNQVCLGLWVSVPSTHHLEKMISHENLHV